MKKLNKLIALIPARSGSQRIKDKNIINFFGKPLIYYSIKSAINSGIFDKIIVCTDSLKYANISKKYGAHVPFIRPKKISKSSSSDFEWVSHAINYLSVEYNEQYTHFFILRPTNPFRGVKTIKRAWRIFKNSKADSLRAIEKVKQHPGKMWKKKNSYIVPYKKKFINNQPTYNNQSKVLENLLVQNASLEISKVNVLKKYNTITGKKILPFYTNDLEGFDINYPIDIEYAKLKMNTKLLDKIIK